MIDSLLIRNFRLFKELKINKLANVNLFVGKNNCGKSCLLEALQVYATGGSAHVLQELVFLREEDWNGASTPGAVNSIKNIDAPYRFLFHGYHFPEKESGAIEIGPTGNGKKRIKIIPRVYRVAEDDHRRVKIPMKDQSLDQLVDADVGLELEMDGESRFLDSLLDPRPYSSKRKRRIDHKTKENVQVVSPRGIEQEVRISQLWDDINLTGLEDEVIKCLHLIDPNISKIAFVGDFQDRNWERYRIPIVRYADSEERIPLKSLGDGMTRLFHIILSLVSAKDSYLLIDEFENGLHWSIQADLWDIVFTLAERLKVQVFATTHNKDCVRGFHEAWSEREKEGTFHRIDVLKDSKIVVTDYTGETLSDALETEVEVR